MLLILTIPFLIAFYFLLIRPQQQRVREHEELVAALTVGDRVVTAGGIHGVLVAVTNLTVEIEVAPGTVLTLARPAISRLAEDPDAVDEPEATDTGPNDPAVDPVTDRPVVDDPDGEDE